jgi:hypothetical protein
MNAQPGLTPLLLVIQRRFQAETFMAMIPLSLQARGNVIKTWKIISFSMFAIFGLSSRDYQKSILSIIPTTALLLVYISLIPRRNMSKDIFPFITEKSIASLSARVIVILLVGLGLEASFLGFSLNNLVAITVSGVGKALSWVFLIRTVSIHYTPFQ